MVFHTDLQGVLIALFRRYAQSDQLGIELRDLDDIGSHLQHDIEVRFVTCSGNVWIIRIRPAITKRRVDDVVVRRQQSAFRIVEQQLCVDQTFTVGQ